jgi:hypothetical protein
MSRGLGLLQQRLLDALGDGLLYTVRTLAVHAYNIPPSVDGLHRVTEAQTVAVRRALNGLMERKLACHDGYRCLDGRPLKLWYARDSKIAENWSPPRSNRAIAAKVGCSEATIRRTRAEQRSPATAAETVAGNDPGPTPDCLRRARVQP